MARLPAALLILLTACGADQPEPVAPEDQALAHVLRDAPPGFLADPLVQAAVEGDADEVRGLLDGRTFEDKDAAMDGLLAFVASSRGCSPAVLTVILDAGGSLSRKDDTGSTVLLYSAASGAADCYDHLLALGADPAGINVNGYGAISHAYLSGNQQLFDAILGSRSEKSPIDLATALGLAVRKEDWAACRSLLDAGAEASQPALPDDALARCR